MAITASTSTWDKKVSRHPTINALISSRLKIFLVTVTYGAGDNYATGGNAISLKGNGKIKRYVEVFPTDNDKALFLRYDKTNEKILAYGEIKDDAAGVNTDAAAFTELTAASSIVNSMVATFLVIGE